MGRFPETERTAPTPDDRGRCGTARGYQAHRKRGEYACDACRKAHNEATKARNHGKRIRVKPEGTPKRDVPADVHAGLAEIPKAAPKSTPTEAKAEAPKPAKATPTPQVPDGVPTPPDWLKARGLELWIEVNQAHKLNASALVLLGEACRTADRLERLAAALSSRSTMWFELGDLDQASELGIPIVVNGMIGEARQLQTALRQTLTNLGVVKVDAANDAAKSPLDQIAEKRKQRLAAQGGA